MTINYGKRNPGGLTAASPGDTLYIPLQFFNDSGASISVGSTLAVTDIEVFKNGGVVQRATDSGYTVLGDTGNFDSRIGFKGISLSLFNTSDDTGFYDAGSSYWVGIDSVTVDSRIVRFWPAVFEVGEPRANVVQVAGDTGASAHLAQMVDEYDTGRLPAEASATLDTGAINQAVWAANTSRTLTGWTFDTGVQQAIARLDTGLRDTLADFDTGLRDHIVDHSTDTGLRDFIGDIDTGLRNTLADYDTGMRDYIVDYATDTGLRDFIADIDTGLRDTLADYDTGMRDFITNIDTGLTETIDRILADTDTGIQPLTLAQIVDGIWDEQDTGHADTGTFGRLRPALTAVKVKTDGLAFTVAGFVDSNIQYVNDIAVTGTGDTGAGTPWGP